MKLVLPLIASTGGLFNDPDARAFAVTAGAMVAWVEICKGLSKAGFLSSWGRRKIVHMGTGPLFMLMLPLFNADSGRLWAACVPLAMTVKFFLIGMGLMQDEDAVNSMSRSGDRRELLRGPTLYGAVFVLCTALVWKDFRSVIALCALCFGDGAAEIWGRQFGKGNALPWSPTKSHAGTIGFIVTSAVCTLLFSTLLLLRGSTMRRNGHSIISLIRSCVPRVVVVNIVAALCESLPLGEFDNLAVFVAAAAADATYCEVFKSRSRIIDDVMRACL